MKKKKNQIHQRSINNYLNLSYRTWIIELEIGDFGASIANLLELPLKIYESNAKAHFWTFLQIFLRKCEIGFILKQSKGRFSSSDTINLALIGYWEDKRYAIPLWFLNELLLGFEIIHTDECSILDSEPLSCNLETNFYTNEISKLDKIPEILLFEDDLFQGKKIFLKINKGNISVSEYFDELGFLERIAQTEIPEIDKLKDNY